MVESSMPNPLTRLTRTTACSSSIPQLIPPSSQFLGPVDIRQRNQLLELRPKVRELSDVQR